jgi:hypothetical protein
MGGLVKGWMLEKSLPWRKLGGVNGWLGRTRQALSLALQVGR